MDRGYVGKMVKKIAQKSRTPDNTKLKLGIGLAGIVLVLAMLFAVPGLLRRNAAPEGLGAPVLEADGSQVIRMQVYADSYGPAEFTVEAGKPVKWVIDGSKATGCTQYLLSTELGISKRLTAGETIIDFTPAKRGSFAFSCSMNMAKGVIHVV